MIAAAKTYPLITQSTTTLKQEVRPFSRRGPLNFANTNRLLKNADWDIELSKTGYIHEAAAAWSCGPISRVRKSRSSCSIPSASSPLR